MTSLEILKAGMTLLAGSRDRLIVERLMAVVVGDELERHPEEFNIHEIANPAKLFAAWGSAYGADDETKTVIYTKICKSLSVEGNAAVVDNFCNDNRVPGMHIVAGLWGGQDEEAVRARIIQLLQQEGFIAIHVIEIH